MNDTERLYYLWQQVASNESTVEELQELLRLVQNSAMEKVSEDWMIGYEASLPRAEGYSQRRLQEVLQKIRSLQTPVRSISPLRKYRWLVAAAVFIAVIAGSYFMFFNRQTVSPSIADNNHTRPDVEAPKTSRAMVTLANGTIVYLDSADNGTLATQQNVQLIKTGDGQLVYNGPSLTTDHSQLTYNTLTNPRGSKVIDMTLSDGSHVWLNAASSITYPVAFTGTERKVSITGEAYFEVAHNASKPFYVSKGDMEVKVLGTHFNVNAYDDEDDIRVTLLEGSVEVKSRLLSGQNSKVRIVPGEQAAITHNPIAIGSQPDSYRVTTHHPDLDEVMAWKNGKFDFGNGTGLKDIMKQVSRWYDVDIVYNKDVNENFWGSVSREVSVTKVLEKFELTGRIHFKIEGRKIIVNP